MLCLGLPYMLEELDVFPHEELSLGTTGLFGRLNSRKPYAPKFGRSVEVY
jgi:hypothetical protein